MNILRQISFLIAVGLFSTSSLVGMKRRLEADCNAKLMYQTLARQETDKVQRFHNKGLYKKEAFNADEFYQDLVKEYKEYEGHLEKIQHIPQASMWGGINFTMTLNEMKEKIQEKFIAMKNYGLIISIEEFEEIKHQYYRSHRCPHTNLTRIWGADYLKEKIEASSKLRERYEAPDYIIVADDPDKIDMTLYFGDVYCPIVDTLKNAKIYFKKIKGSGVASRSQMFLKDIGIESKIGYDDFSDCGNIIQQYQLLGTECKPGKYCIVDTEQRSFNQDYILKQYWWKLPLILEYAQKRFNHLNPTKRGEITYEIDLQS